MNADLKGALQQLNRSYKAFEHKGKRMTKQQVKAVLEYGIKQGYKHTGQLSDDEIDNVIESINKKDSRLKCSSCGSVLVKDKVGDLYCGNGLCHY